MGMISVGPTCLGIVLDADARFEQDWIIRDMHIPPGLDGPPDVLQGGLAVGALIDVARAIDTFRAPVTRVDARLHAPTPVGATVVTRAKPTDAVATYDVQTWFGSRLLVSATVELAGSEPSMHAYDLATLSTVPVPPSTPQDRYPSCWICGAASMHPTAQRMFPGWHDDTTIVCQWVADEQLGTFDHGINPVIVAAVLDCPTAWSCITAVDQQGRAAALLGSYNVRFLRAAPVLEPVRVVARLDDVDGRTMTARGALIDDDGATYAVATSLQIGVDKLPVVAPPR